MAVRARAWPVEQSSMNVFCTQSSVASTHTPVDPIAPTVDPTCARQSTILHGHTHWWPAANLVSICCPRHLGHAAPTPCPPDPPGFSVSVAAVSCNGQLTPQPDTRARVSGWVPSTRDFRRPSLPYLLGFQASSLPYLRRLQVWVYPLVMAILGTIFPPPERQNASGEAFRV